MNQPTSSYNEKKKSAQNGTREIKELKWVHRVQCCLQYCTADILTCLGEVLLLCVLVHCNVNQAVVIVIKTTCAFLLCSQSTINLVRRSALFFIAAICPLVLPKCYTVCASWFCKITIGIII